MNGRAYVKDRFYSRNNKINKSSTQPKASTISMGGAEIENERETLRSDKMYGSVAKILKKAGQNADDLDF